MSINPKDIFQRYRRGFYGKPIREINTESESSKLLRQLNNLQYNRKLFEVDEKTTIFNEAVEVLFAQQSKGIISTYTFEFHDSVIKAALSAFGTENFIAWLSLQEQSSMASAYHSKFLIDTLEFIQSGRREIVHESWEFILNSANPDDEWLNVIDKAKNVFGLSSQCIGSDSSTIMLRDVIVKWCSQPNGINDLLKTLHVLFGR